MNYLQLVQTCALLCRGSNGKISNPLESIDTAEGLDYEIVQWVRMADKELQEIHPLLIFMRKTARLQVSAGQWQVPLPSAVGDFAQLAPYVAGQLGDFIIVEQVIDGETRIANIPLVSWSNWAGGPHAMTRRAGTVTAATLAPGGVLTFNAEPDTQLTVQLDYRRKAIPMPVDDQAVPSVPEDHHMFIVYWAMVHGYCLTRDNTRELRAKCEERLRSEKNRYYNAQLPDFTRSFPA